MKVNSDDCVQLLLYNVSDTPAPSQFEIDDEFNLPISVAISILVGYIFVGATIYCMWEEWTFFESFYFVFISMSTIGFGDYVPHVSTLLVDHSLYFEGVCAQDTLRESVNRRG